jgi:alkylresorcinol/alkylpyrone synthase
MGWDVAEDGLKVVFSRDIPSLVRDDLRPVIDAFLARHDLDLGDIDGFVCHPGGAKVVDALEACFDLRPGALAVARGTLRDFGNMSAATVLFVLRAAMDAGPAIGERGEASRGRRLMTTLGPGFTAGMMMLEG